MFKNSIDKKPEVTIDNVTILNLTESIFDMSKSSPISYNTYRISADYVMRPDLVSISAYSTDEHTEMILKLNGIINPFTIDEDDVIIIPSIDNINDNLVERNTENYEGDSAIRNTYKYIDKAKFPNTNSADNNKLENQVVGKNVTPANIAPEGTNAITNRNGRIYFGENTGVLCAQNGIASGEYLVAKVSNKNNETSN